MAGQFKLIINHFNNRRTQNRFTSTDFNDSIRQIKTDVEITRSSVSNFIDVTFKMGILSREVLKNRKYSGPKYVYTKMRSLTPDEIHTLTTRPQCYEFKKQLDAAHRIKMEQLPKASPTKTILRKKTPPVKEKAKKQETVNVKAAAGAKITIAEHAKKTVITIFK